MRTKYKVVLLFIAILWLVAILVAFKYFRYDPNTEKKNDTTLVVTTGSLSLNFPEGNIINAKTLIPGEQVNKAFTISNAGEETIYFSIVLTSVINDFGENDDIVYEIFNRNTNTIVSDNSMINEDGKIADYLEIQGGETRRFEIIITYKAGSNNANENLNNTISATIGISEETKKISTFKEVLLVNNQINTQSRTQIANDISTVEEGLISENDADGNTYYFRGIVDNNHVEFGGYNWRITRINGNGSIRIVMDELVNNIGVTYSDDKITEEVEDIKELFNYKNSNLKEQLESWYNSYLTDYENYIDNGNFCYDNFSLSDDESTTIEFNTYNRLMVDKNPTFTCLGENIEGKVGLLSADEVIFAGAAGTQINRNFYLYNSAFQNGWWTMSPLKIDKAGTISMYDVRTTGNLSTGTLANLSRSLRPVINLDGNIEIIGNGTKDNPYKLVDISE